MMTSSDDDESGSSQDFRFRIQNSKKTADEVPAGEAGDAHSSTLSLISVLEDFNKHNVMYRKSVSDLKCELELHADIFSVLYG